jgi:hypothetical protein
MRYAYAVTQLESLLAVFEGIHMHLIEAHDPTKMVVGV